MRGGCDLHGKGDGRIKPMAMHPRIGILPAAPQRAPARRFLDVRAVEMLRATSDTFRFLRPPLALQRFRQGEPIAEDGERLIRAPFPRTVLLLPRPRPPRGGEAGLLGESLGV